MKQLNRLMFVALLSAPVVAHAQDILGAEKILELAMTDGGDRPEPALTSVGLLKADIERFRDVSATLSSELAAREWLTFVDRLQVLKTQGKLLENEDMRIRGILELVRNLPPPASWDALITMIRARPIPDGTTAISAHALRLLAALLSNDVEAQWHEISELDTKLKEMPQESVYIYRYSIEEIVSTLERKSRNPERTIRLFKLSLGRLAKMDTGEMTNDFEIPDLVRLVGEEKATELIEKTLRSIKIPIGNVDGKDTGLLTQRLALDFISELHVPQWSLVRDENAVTLYEAFIERYPLPTGHDPDSDMERDVDDSDEIIDLILARRDERMLDRYSYRWAQARDLYFAQLIIAGQDEKAMAVAKEAANSQHPVSEYAIQNQLMQAKSSMEVFELLHRVMSFHPELGLWTTYLNLAAKVSRLDDAQKLIEATLDTWPKDDERHAALADHLITMFLAAGRPEEGVALIRKKMKADLSGSIDSWRPSEAFKLFRLGRLLERPDWVEEALRYGETLMNSDDFQRRFRSAYEYIANLIELGRHAEAERRLAELLREVVNIDEQDSQIAMYGQSTAPEILIKLVRLYHQIGRFDDVITLLDEAPWWGVKDIAKLGNRNDIIDFMFSVGPDYSSRPTNEYPLDYILADALYAKGRNAEARRLTKALVRQQPGYDPAYELLVTIDGPDAIPFLDMMIAQDQFQERPLIWKAHVLRQTGQFDEALETVMRAIAIDPSDGEQGPDTRMRAYAELRDIHLALGNESEAELFRSVVQAIRIGEEADALFNAGLRAHGIAKYNVALEMFASAYCLQSRLAIQLASAGRHEEAAVHYRRAYELMPDSFGRMESHCFGCEQVFNDEYSQGLAEEVFLGLIEDDAERPIVHYLLGYLRENQERFDDALEAFSKVVELDPDYFNAWLHILGLQHRTNVAGELVDQAVINTIRLDPQGRYGELDISAVSDMRLLWRAIESIPKRDSGQLESVYMLAASRLRIEKLEQAMREAGMPGTFDRRYLPYQLEILSKPGDALIRHDAIRNICELFDASRMW